MAKFQHGRATRQYVREQMIGGALAALAFTRIHYPEIDLDLIGGGPPFSDGSARVTILPHYRAERGAAEDVIGLVENETHRLTREREDASSDSD